MVMRSPLGAGLCPGDRRPVRGRRSVRPRPPRWPGRSRQGTLDAPVALGALSTPGALGGGGGEDVGRAGGARAGGGQGERVRGDAALGTGWDDQQVDGVHGLADQGDHVRVHVAEPADLDLAAGSRDAVRDVVPGPRGRPTRDGPVQSPVDGGDEARQLHRRVLRVRPPGPVHGAPAAEAGSMLRRASGAVSVSGVLWERSSGVMIARPVSAHGDRSSLSPWATST